MNRFGEALNELLASIGSNKRNLALNTGLTPTTVSKVCRGVLTPSLPVLQKCCSFFKDSDSQATLLIARLQDLASESGVNPSLVAISRADTVADFSDIDISIVALCAKLAHHAQNSAAVLRLLKSSLAIIEGTAAHNAKSQVQRKNYSSKPEPGQSEPQSQGQPQDLRAASGS